jgi:16S rRNA processing protein RimM
VDSDSQRVLLGYVVRAHGLRGALRVRPHSGRAAETARALARVRTLYLDAQAYDLRRVRDEREELLIELDEVADKDAADALRGRTVSVDRASLPAPDADEVYLADLVGCEVFDPAGKRIGVVEGSYHAGAHETLIVKDGAREHLLPWVSHMIVEVDLAARRVVFDPPPGMIDLDDAEAG